METNKLVLFEKLLKNSCSEEELQLLISYLSRDKPDTVYHDLLLGQLAKPVKPEEITSSLKAKLEANLELILKETSAEPQTVKRKHLYFNVFYKYAAAVLLVLSIGFYFYNQNRNEKLAMAKLDELPSGNVAVLTLADGKRISLPDAKNGKLAEQTGVQIFKTAEGQLSYSGVDAGHSQKSIGFNTISTPKGGQYQVQLPDGTKVWLNAASSLSYPASFAAVDIREVKLKGEAYFEVAKVSGKPFQVKTDRQMVEVLGTHFNINSYEDEPLTRTTLLEGLVRVAALGKSEMLKPGQQAVLQKGGIAVLNVDAAATVAWKNGYFQFNDEELESLMRKVVRWYDVKVVYEDPELKKVRFAGLTNRFLKVSELLQTLKMTRQVDFEVNDRTITVKQY